MGEKIIHGIHRFLEILEIVLAAVIVLVLVALMGIERSGSLRAIRPFFWRRAFSIHF